MSHITQSRSLHKPPPRPSGHVQILRCVPHLKICARLTCSAGQSACSSASAALSRVSSGGLPCNMVICCLQDELLMSAATEFAIYNAQRPLLPSRLPTRSVHAPARRIARTLVCLGRQVSQAGPRAQQAQCCWPAASYHLQALCCKSLYADLCNQEQSSTWLGLLRQSSVLCMHG